MKKEHYNIGLRSPMEKEKFKQLTKKDLLIFDSFYGKEYYTKDGYLIKIDDVFSAREGLKEKLIKQWYIYENDIEEVIKEIDKWINIGAGENKK